MTFFRWYSSLCMGFILLNTWPIVFAKDSYCSFSEQQSILRLSDDGNPALQCVMNFINGLQDSTMIDCGTKICLEAVRSIKDKAPDCLQIDQKITFNETVQAFLQTCTEARYPNDTSSSSSNNGTDIITKVPKEGPVCSKEEILQIINFGVGSPALQCLAAFELTMNGANVSSCGEKECITAVKAIKDASPACIPVKMDFQATFRYVVETFLNDCDDINKHSKPKRTSTSSTTTIVSMIMTIVICCILSLKM